MEDEYGDMDSSGKTFVAENFRLESGTVMRDVQLRYRTWGTLNEARDNCLVVCHALTGNAALNDWWGSFLGDGLPFDTSKYYVICSNLLGSCYGSTGPTSVNPDTGHAYGKNFPYVTVRDAVALQKRMVKEAEGINEVRCVIGGSLGGMQTIEWLFPDTDRGSNAGGANADMGPDVSAEQPLVVQSAMPMACGSHHHTWQVAVSETQRQAIKADLAYKDGAYAPDEPPLTGLGLARQIAMVSYRSHQAYEHKFGRRRTTPDGGEVPQEEVPMDAPFTVENYLSYQGEKFNGRFDANSYITLTELMDSHDIGRGRGGIEAAAASIDLPIHVIGIDSDVLYPLSEQQDLAELFPQAKLSVIRNDDGHDGFLLAQDAIGPLISEFLRKQDANAHSS